MDQSGLYFRVIFGVQHNSFGKFDNDSKNFHNFDKILVYFQNSKNLISFFLHFHKINRIQLSLTIKI